jgi:hypothetical protein
MLVKYLGVLVVCSTWLFIHVMHYLLFITLKSYLCLSVLCAIEG